MEFVHVIVAALAAYAFAAVWYTVMSKAWIVAAGIPVGPDGRPMGGGNPVPFIVGFIAQVLVAGMMRHVFAMSGLDTVGEGIMGGVGIGLFLITPWVTMNYVFAGRSRQLALLDGVNAVVGCTLIGIVLTLW